MITGRINQNSRAHVALIVGRGAADCDGAGDGPSTVARLPRVRMLFPSRPRSTAAPAGGNSQTLPAQL